MCLRFLNNLVSVFPCVPEELGTNISLDIYVLLTSSLLKKSLHYLFSNYKKIEKNHHWSYHPESFY